MGAFLNICRLAQLGACPHKQILSKFYSSKYILGHSRKNVVIWVSWGCFQHCCSKNVDFKFCWSSCTSDWGPGSPFGPHTFCCSSQALSAYHNLCQPEYMYVWQPFLDLKLVIEVFEDETLLPAGCKGIRREGGRPLLVEQLPGIEKYNREIKLETYLRNMVEEHIWEYRWKIHLRIPLPYAVEKYSWKHICKIQLRNTVVKLRGAQEGRWPLLVGRLPRVVASSLLSLAAR